MSATWYVLSITENIASRVGLKKPATCNDIFTIILLIENLLLHKKPATCNGVPFTSLVCLNFTCKIY